MCAVMISDKAYATMQDWQSEKPVAVLMGEFSSGKSTLLNLILGKDVAQTQVTATPLPPIWFTASKSQNCTGLRRDGTECPVDLADENVDFRNEYLVIRIGSNCEALSKFDIIDAPGLSDPNLHKDAIRFLARYTDFAIWCTPSSQAWRQSERTAFEKLSKTTQSKSFLAITRFDKLRTDKDRAKVLKRVRTEAGPHFNSIVPLATVKAAAIPLDKRSDDSDGAWAKSGGLEFYKALEQSLNLSEKTPSHSAKTQPKKPKIEATGKKSNSKKAKAKAPSTGTKKPWAEVVKMIQTFPGNEQFVEETKQLAALISDQTSIMSKDGLALQQCTRISGDDLDLKRLISQIGQELRAFSGGNTIRLDTQSYR